MNNSYQRKGAKSNYHAGKEFERDAHIFLSSIGINLITDVKVPIGINIKTKSHTFDLGCLHNNIIVECKSHTWTSSGNIPSAKLTVWNEAMYYFLAAPKGFRKIMFVLYDFNNKRNETLAQHYLRRYSHLVPEGVEFWEYNKSTKQALRLDTDPLKI